MKKIIGGILLAVCMTSCAGLEEYEGEAEMVDPVVVRMKEIVADRTYLFSDVHAFDVKTLGEWKSRYYDNEVDEYGVPLPLTEYNAVKNGCYRDLFTGLSGIDYNIWRYRVAYREKEYLCYVRINDMSVSTREGKDLYTVVSYSYMVYEEAEQ